VVVVLLVGWCSWPAKLHHSALFKLSLVCCCLDTSIHAFDDRTACLVLCWPCWPRYLPLPRPGDKIGSLMIIYSGYTYFWLPLVFLSFWFCLVLFAGNKRRRKEKKRKKTCSL
jgi:hypothetical protein